MKIFAIRNEEDENRKDLGYLIYYEKPRRFYIELPDDADPWETPLILSSCLKRGEKTDASSQQIFNIVTGRIKTLNCFSR